MPFLELDAPDARQLKPIDEAAIEGGQVEHGRFQQGGQRSAEKIPQHGLED
jgi:hypothetical protein